MMLKIMLNDIHNIIDGFMFPIIHRLWSAIVPMCYNRNIRPDIVILTMFETFVLVDVASHSEE
jgi:hypothetical protein